MLFAEIKSRLLGDWSGTNHLHLSWLTPSDYHSSSQMAIAAVAHEKFLTLMYTWSHENKAHEGLLVLGYDAAQQVATASWLDSWHMSSKLMSCTGTIDERGEIAVKGYYEAPPDPDWGWRIVIAVRNEALRMTMYNCTPAGEEELAVQADYVRAI